MNKENENKTQNSTNKNGVYIPIIIIGVIGVIVLLMCLIFMPKENNDPINDVNITVVVDETTYNDMAYLKDNVVYIKGEVLKKTDDLTMEDIEALGYSVVYNRIDTEITVSINTSQAPVSGGGGIGKNDQVGVTEVNLDDPANLVKGSDGLYYYNLGAALGAELIVKDGFKYDSEKTMADNVTDFQEQMVGLDPNIAFKDGSMSCLGVGDVSIEGTSNSIKVATPLWGTSVDLTSTELTCIINRNLYLNTLNYFGDVEMVKAVYGLIDEHYRFSDHTKEITDEMAEKYGLTLSNSKTKDDIVSCDVSDGANTWNITYMLSDTNSGVSVLIPIYTKT